MEGEKKIKKLKKQISKSYRLAVMEEDSYQEKFALSLSKRNIFLITSSVAFIIILITTLLIFYTPIREYIPGYDTSKLRIQAVENLEKLDSLMISLKQNEQFVEAFSRTLLGEDFKSQYEDSQLKAVDLTELDVNINIEDSILRNIVEVEDRFNIIERDEKPIPSSCPDRWWPGESLKSNVRLRLEQCCIKARPTRDLPQSAAYTGLGRLQGGFRNPTAILTYPPRLGRCGSVRS